jgi:hypothetical protein
MVAKNRDCTSGKSLVRAFVALKSTDQVDKEYKAESIGVGFRICNTILKKLPWRKDRGKFGIFNTRNTSSCN